MAAEDLNMTDHNDYSYSKLLLLKKPIFNLFDEALLPSTDLDNMTVKRLKSNYTHLQSDENFEWISMQFKEVELLYEALKASRKALGGDQIYMFDIIRHSVLDLPKPAPLVRSKELEFRLEKLQKQAEDAEYRAMTKNVGGGQFVNQEPLASELKVLDSQIMFMFNFLVTVVAAFAFGYKATEYILADPNLSMQLIVGMCFATLVFIADVYFVIRDIDKDDNKLKQS